MVTSTAGGNSFTARMVLFHTSQPQSDTHHICQTPGVELFYLGDLVPFISSGKSGGFPSPSIWDPSDSILPKLDNYK